MIKVGKWIAKHKVLIVIISMLLLIPSFLGMAATRVNYDILSYLPDSLETVEGQDIMVDEFGMGAFSMVVVENMDLKDVAALKEKFQDVDHVKDVLWYDSVADLSIPISMIPDKFKDAFFTGDATMMIALFDNTTSSDAAMEAVTEEQKQSEQTAEKLTASVNVLNVVMTKLAEELGREPNLSEIAAKMQMSEDEVQAVMKEAINAVAVDRSEAAQKEDEALENQ